MLTTATGKPRVSGFHCRQLQKDAYKALKAFMALRDANTEEALQTFIQPSSNTQPGPGSIPRSDSASQKLYRSGKLREPKRR
jgi:hypothetical protein